MNDYEMGVKDCIEGNPLMDLPSEEYLAGYAHQYEVEQVDYERTKN